MALPSHAGGRGGHAGRPLGAPQTLPVQVQLRCAGALHQAWGVPFVVCGARLVAALVGSSRWLTRCTPLQVPHSHPSTAVCRHPCPLYRCPQVPLRPLSLSLSLSQGVAWCRSGSALGDVQACAGRTQCTPGPAPSSTFPCPVFVHLSPPKPPPIVLPAFSECDVLVPPLLDTSCGNASSCKVARHATPWHTAGRRAQGVARPNCFSDW